MNAGKTLRTEVGTLLLTMTLLFFAVPGVFATDLDTMSATTPGYQNTVAISLSNEVTASVTDTEGNEGTVLIAPYEGSTAEAVSNDASGVTAKEEPPIVEPPEGYLNRTPTDTDLVYALDATAQDGEEQMLITPAPKSTTGQPHNTWLLIFGGAVSVLGLAGFLFMKRSVKQ